MLWPFSPPPLLAHSSLPQETESGVTVTTNSRMAKILDLHHPGEGKVLFDTSWVPLMKKILVSPLLPMTEVFNIESIVLHPITSLQDPWFWLWYTDYYPVPLCAPSTEPGSGWYWMNAYSCPRKNTLPLTAAIFPVFSICWEVLPTLGANVPFPASPPLSTPGNLQIGPDS